MKTNSKIKSQKEEIIVGQNDATDNSLVQHVANGKIVLTPDYTRMKQEIHKIRDPVSFEEIKKFYGIA